MKSFIKLTSHVINKLHIVEIIKNQNKYSIYMSNNNISGFLIFGGGYVSSDYNKIEICEKHNKQDYDTITNFINNIH